MNQRNKEILERVRSLRAATETLIQQSEKVMEEMEELEQKTINRIVEQRVGEKRYGNTHLEGLTLPSPVAKKETSENELTKLRETQRKARRDELFGGFTTGERAAFEARTNRINDLEHEIFQSRKKVSEAKIKAAKQRRGWNKQSETDTLRSGSQQPYRSRESDSSNAFSHSKRKSRAKKSDSDQSPDT